MNELNDFNEAFKATTPRTSVPFHQALDQHIKVVSIKRKSEGSGFVVRYRMNKAKRLNTAFLQHDAYGHFMVLGKERIYISEAARAMLRKPTKYVYGVHIDPDMIVRGEVWTFADAVANVNKHLAKFKKITPAKVDDYEPFGAHYLKISPIWNDAYFMGVKDSKPHKRYLEATSQKGGSA